MTMNNMGVGITILARDAASSVVTKVNRSFRALQATTQKMGAGLAMMGSGVKQAALGFAPMALAMGAGVKAAASFEGQMNVVESVMGDAVENMGALKAEARRVGLVTSKSSVEAAQGLELLGRAGFSSKEAIAALQPVVNAAEADGLGLARTAEIVSDSLNAFGEGADQARRFSGVLAFTSANTATSINGLGEGLKFAAPIAKQLGLSFEDTALALGFVANTGLKAGQAGTALKNMMIKLAKPSKAAVGIMKELGLEMADADGNMVPFNDVVGQLIEKVPEMGGNLEQTAKLAELLGLRGQGAGAALIGQFTKLAKNGKLKELQSQIQNAADAAEKMSQTRLKGLSGAMTILAGTVETVATVAFEPFLPLLEQIAKSATATFNDFGLAVGALFNPTDENLKKLKEMNPVLVAIAQGFKDAFDVAKAGFAALQSGINSVGNTLQDVIGADGVRALSKFATLFVFVTAALAPVAIGLVAIGFVLGPIITMLQGAAMIGAALFSPWGAAIAVVAGLLFAFRKQIMEFVGSAGSALGGFMGPIVEGLSAAWEKLTTIWVLFKSIFTAGADEMGMSAGSMGESVGSALGGFFLQVVDKAVAVLDGLKGAVVFLMPVFRFLGTAIMGVVKTLGTLVGDIMEALGAADSGSNAFRTLGQILGVVAAAIAAKWSMAMNVLSAAIGIITPIVSGVISVLMSLVSFVGNVAQVFVNLFSGDFQGALDAGRGAIFEVVKAIITIVGTMVQAIAAAIDGVAKIFGKDLGARDFMKGVQKSLVDDVENVIRGQEAVAKERAEARRAKATQTAAASAEAPAAPVPPSVAPQLTTGIGAPPAPATASEIAGAMKGVTVDNNITLKSELKLNEAQLATAVEKVQKKGSARGQR